MSATVAGLRQLLGGDATLAAARGITEPALDSMYGAARELYGNGHHGEALRIFELLCLYDHESSRNWQGLAACRQMLNDYGGAAAALVFASEVVDGPALDLELSLAECLIAACELDAADIVIARLNAFARDGALGNDQDGKVRLLEGRLAAAGLQRKA